MTPMGRRHCIGLAHGGGHPHGHGLLTDAEMNEARDFPVVESLGQPYLALTHQKHAPVQIDQRERLWGVVSYRSGFKFGHVAQFDAESAATLDVFDF